MKQLHSWSPKAKIGKRKWHSFPDLEEEKSSLSRRAKKKKSTPGTLVRDSPFLNHSLGFEELERNTGTCLAMSSGSLDREKQG